MQAVSKFRGTCGEVVSRYVSPLSYVSALPIAIGLLLINWICSHFGEFRVYLTLPISCAFTVIATMRFAIPASRGDMEPSNELGEILAYSGRYLLLNSAWFLPWLLIWKFLMKSAAPDVAIIFMNPLSALNSPWMLLLRSLFIIIALVMPTLCLLIALYSSTTKGLFSRHSWEWLLKQRRGDLIPFWSNLLGGGLVMFLCALVPALLLVYLGFKDSSRTGLYLAVFLYTWILSTIPLLNGWLAGVFVSHDFIQLEFSADEPLTVVESDAPALQPTIVSRPIEPRPDLADIEQRMAETGDDMLLSALAAARELETSLTAPIRGQIEQMFLALRSGDMEQVRSAAAKAIDGTSQRGFNDISLKLFEKIGAERLKLKLSAYSLEILGNMYQQKKQLLDAAWCLHAAANAGGDSIKAQKRLFQIAELAEKSNNNKDALTLYEILIRQYPNSTLVEFARQGAERLKNQ